MLLNPAPNLTFVPIGNDESLDIRRQGFKCGFPVKWLTKKPSFLSSLSQNNFLKIVFLFLIRVLCRRQEPQGICKLEDFSNYSDCISDTVVALPLTVQTKLNISIWNPARSLQILDVLQSNH